MSRVHLALDGKPPYHAIGLISGTSHDGISAAVVAIDERQSPPLRLLAFKAFPYRKDLRARLLTASAGEGVGTSEIAQLNFVLGWTFGEVALKIADSRTSPRIGSTSSARTAIPSTICRRAARAAGRRPRRSSSASPR